MGEIVKIEVGRDAVVIDWADGSRTVVDAETLRAACPCAGCGAGPSPAPSGIGSTIPLRVVDPAATIVDARLVGEYAVNFTFGPDGHSAGIYPYALLASLGSSG